MATAKLQAWTPATWNWDSAAAGSPLVEVLDEMRSWISAVNANPSQSGKQLQLLKDENSSTTTPYRGYVIQMPMQSQVGDLYMGFYSNSTTNIRGYASTGFNNNTTNGGYGSHTGTVSSETSWGWKTTVTTSAKIIIGHSAVNGEEFFVWGWSLDNSNNHGDFCMVFKDERGEWSATFADDTSARGLVYDDLLTEWRNIFSFETGSSAILLPMSMVASVGPINTEFRYRVRAASPDLLYTPYTSYSQASYVPLPGGDNAVHVSKYGPFVRYTPA